MILVIAAVNNLLFRMVLSYDKDMDFLRTKKELLKEGIRAFGLGMLTNLTSMKEFAVCPLTESWKWIIIVYRLFLLGCINGCFLFALNTDYKMQKVYHFVWWIAGGCSVLLWLTGERVGLEGMILFAVVQNSIFSKFYGRADCHAFTVCGILSYAMNPGMEALWWHMIVSYFLLFLVQLGKRNVNTKGQLTEPVAFVPYIVCAFWLCQLWHLHY